MSIRDRLRLLVRKIAISSINLRASDIRKDGHLSKRFFERKDINELIMNVIRQTEHLVTNPNYKRKPSVKNKISVQR